jgi:Flp pilus assembly protein TadG
MSDRSGNFGMLTALMMVPLIGAAGLAIDFGRALSLKAELSAAADAAAVGAVAEKSAAVTQAMAAGNGSVSLDATEARKLFFGQVSANDIDIPVDVSIQLQKTNNVITSQVTYTATLPTTFMQILGKNEITVSNVATAVYATPSFMDFFMLLDNTPSMGVAATTEDIANMQYATRNGNSSGGDKNCAFACHIVSTAGVEDPSSYYNVALKNNITIRIDVVAEATKALMTTAAQTQMINGQFRMAAYTFGQSAQDAKLFKVAELTPNFSTVASATENIKLMSIPYQNYNSDQQTSFDTAFAQMGSEITGTVGGGTSAADREKIVFFVSDGVADAAKSTSCTSPKGKVDSTRCIEPIDIKNCTALKDRNIKIAVLYTTYLPLPSNDFWTAWVKPFDSNIASKMQACASPGYFFQVSPSQGITEAMETLFRKIVSTPRITS